LRTDPAQDLNQIFDESPPSLAMQVVLAANSVASSFFFATELIVVESLLTNSFRATSDWAQLPPAITSRRHGNLPHEIFAWIRFIFIGSTFND
jgi:hypothetical protein